MLLLLGLGYLHRSTPLPANAWLVVPLLFFSAMVALRTNSTITILNVLAGLGILTLLLTTWNRQVLARFVVLGYALVAVLAAASVAVRPFVLLADAAATLAPRPARRIVRQVLLGLMLAVPFLGIFTALFV